MKDIEVQSEYLRSSLKRAFDVVVSLMVLIVGLPVFLTIALVIIITSGCPVLFVQNRAGAKGKVFAMYKFRTMYVGAERDQEKYQYLNEANKAVFKISNDPRFVGIGNWLSHMGLDELPQFINVLKGEMSVVGPRPLPLLENERVVKMYPWRQKIKPGLVCFWQLEGAHLLSFEQWMKMDLDYYQFASLRKDIGLVTKSLRNLMGVLG